MEGGKDTTMSDELVDQWYTGGLFRGSLLFLVCRQMTSLFRNYVPYSYLSRQVDFGWWCPSDQVIHIALQIPFQDFQGRVSLSPSGFFRFQEFFGIQEISIDQTGAIIRFTVRKSGMMAGYGVGDEFSHFFEDG